MAIVINTPNGHIGRPLTRLLLESGREVRIIHRTPEKVSDLTALGATVFEGSVEDDALLSRAFEGATHLFWLNPPNLQPGFKAWSGDLGRRAAQRAAAAGISRVVVLSSLGAHRGEGVGPVSALLPIEDAFRSLIPHVAALRPTFFMENLLGDIATVKKTGAVFSVTPENVAFPMVATVDIAHAAASFLLSDGWQGHVIRGVHGPTDVTYKEIVREMGHALGRDVAYHQVTVEQARSAMREGGTPDFVVDIYGEMMQAMVDGRMTGAEPRTPETTTPTSLRRWLNTHFKAAYEGSAQG